MEGPLRVAFAELIFSVYFRFFGDLPCDLSGLLDVELLRVATVFLRPTEGRDFVVLVLLLVLDFRVRVEVNFDVSRGDTLLPDFLLLEDLSPDCFLSYSFDGVADFFGVAVTLSRPFDTAVLGVLFFAKLVVGADLRILPLSFLLFDALLDLMLFDALVLDFFLSDSFDRVDDWLDVLVIFRGRFTSAVSKGFFPLSVLVDLADFLLPRFFELASFDLFSSCDVPDDRFDDWPAFDLGALVSCFCCTLRIAAAERDLWSASALLLLEPVFGFFCLDVRLGEELSTICLLRVLVGFCCRFAPDEVLFFELAWRPLELGFVFFLAWLGERVDVAGTFRLPAVLGVSLFEPLEDRRFGFAETSLFACAWLALLFEGLSTDFLVRLFFVPSVALPEPDFSLIPTLAPLRPDDDVLGVRPVFAFLAGLPELTDSELAFAVVFFEVPLRLGAAAFLGGVSKDRLLFRPLAGFSLRLARRVFFGGLVSLDLCVDDDRFPLLPRAAFWVAFPSRSGFDADFDLPVFWAGARLDAFRPELPAIPASSLVIPSSAASFRSFLAL